MTIDVPNAAPGLDKKPSTIKTNITKFNTIFDRDNTITISIREVNKYME